MALPDIPFLYLRHGETDWNAALLAQGSSDIPLNARGREQAEAAASILGGVEVDAIVASPLSRAAETARVAGARLGLPVTLEPELREVSFGVEEGAPMGPWYEAWLRSESTPEGGESFADLMVRAERALGPHLVPGRRTLFVAHGALFRAIRALLGLSVDQRLANAVPLECTVENGIWRVEVVVSRQHAV